MTTAPVQVRTPVFAFQSAVLAQPTVGPERPSSAEVIGALLRAEDALVTRERRASDAGTSFTFAAVFLAGAGLLATMFTDKPLFLAAGVATATALGIGTWFRQHQGKQRDVQALGIRGAEQAAATASPLEHTLMRAIARRADRASKTGPLTGLVADLRQSGQDVSPDLISRVDAVFASLYRGGNLTLLYREGDLTLVHNPLDNAERLIWALESSPPEERPILARFIADRLGAEFFDRSLEASDAIRRDMLREAIDGRRYVFPKQTGEEGNDPTFNVAVAGVDFTLRQAAELAPKQCPWGRTYCDLDIAKRVAAHFEELGYRVSIAEPDHYHHYHHPAHVSLVVYADKVDPGDNLHHRPALARAI